MGIDVQEFQDYQNDPEAERLTALLHRRVGKRVRDLRVLLSKNGLILQGKTATYHSKQIIQHAAMEISDMPIAANDIEVL